LIADLDAMREASPPIRSGTHSVLALVRNIPQLSVTIPVFSFQR
jgi:hypothetical protein